MLVDEPGGAAAAVNHPRSSTLSWSPIPRPLRSATAGPKFQKWNVDVFVNNPLDSHPQLNLSHQDQFSTLFEATTFRPRNFGVSATFRY